MTDATDAKRMLGDYQKSKNALPFYLVFTALATIGAIFLYPRHSTIGVFAIIAAAVSGLTLVMDLINVFYCRKQLARMDKEVPPPPPPARAGG